MGAQASLRPHKALRERAKAAEAHDLWAGPMRGDPLGAEHLAERARAVARAQQVRPPGERRFSLTRPAGLARLEETRRIVTAARSYLSADAKLDIGPAGDWLLDNFYVIDQYLREVREGLPRGYYRELPVSATGPFAGEPRIFELAITLIAHTEGRIDLPCLELFVAAVQEIAPFSLGELWALPAMIRLALIENVRRMTLRTVRRLEELEEADAWAARIEAASERGGAELRQALEAFVGSERSLTATFVSRFLHQLRVTSAPSPPLAKLERWVADEGLSAEDASARASQRLALTQMVMANSITSLRAVAGLDWVAFVERQSVTEAALRRDPSGHYPKMTPASRDLYRHQVERVARGSAHDEVAIAERAVALAQKRSDTQAEPARNRHVGYFLVDRGCDELERAVAYRAAAPERLRRFMLRHPHVPFAGGAFTITLVLLAALCLPASSWRDVMLICAVALLPTIELAVSIVHRLVTASLPPRRIVKLEIPDTTEDPLVQTVVVMPVLFDSAETLTSALHNLEIQYLSNPESYLRFALLGDFADAATASQAGDADIIATAMAGLRALNERHRGSGHEPFHLLHRPRRLNASESCWMGWERKRGKLAQLNEFLRGGADDAFSHVVGDTARLREARFVITLDADTRLPAEAAAKLVGALAHPLNRPVFDAASGLVVDGYGILQPRVSVSLPSAQGSRFAALASGVPGVDPYTTASSDVYQDLFWEGSYSGKGIYDVEAFVRATEGRFPENTLLSHDLIEGGFARAGLVSDVDVYDDYPARYLTFTRRKHRWIRGDWQLLPWLARNVPGPATQRRNPLSALSRLKIFDNLRRSLTELAQLVLLFAGWTVLPGSPGVWTLLTLSLIAAPYFTQVAFAVFRPPLDRSWAAYYAALGRDLRTSGQQFALAVVVLPHQAWISVDAIARTLYRLLVTRRHLLEWQTAAQSELGASGSAAETFRHMASATLAACLGALLVAAYRWLTNQADHDFRLLDLVPVLVFLPLWLAGPVITHGLSLPRARRRAPLTSAERGTVRRHAELHWHFFERFTNADTGWLPPDNVQDELTSVVAMRTSPTNIGLGLLSTVSAHDLGFITIEQMLARLEHAFDTLDRLPRYRGHLFNWYSLETWAVLEPAYVSTVDSGNLAGHCIALRQACLALAATSADDALRDRLTVLAERAYRLYDEMDFAFLFDPGRKLFAIGYQTGANALDGSYYDLLASESRLASFVAIAKNDAPVEHWFRLGRTLTQRGGETALASWSGSMFEYLMPVLVMHTFAGTLLDQTHRGAVRRQVAYGRSHSVPWGVSESAYNVRDRHATYQYRAFGVPNLALKRGLESDLVIAPYATLLALMVDPKCALENLARLEELGVTGAFGLRDAIDYTRPDPGSDHALVHTYMAHHIGMGLVALTNMLREDIWPRRFHADPLVASAELLLQERVPWALSYLEPHPKTPEPERWDAAAAAAAATGERSFEANDNGEPHVALLGLPPYTLMISHAGAGYSRFEDLAVTRFRADGTRDHTGQFCYIKDVTSRRLWSATHQPVCAPPDFYRALFTPDRASFRRVDGLIETYTEVAVAPQDAAEIRRVTVTNRSDEVRLLELTSYGEIVLAPPETDRAHPAFSNLFVETEWHPWCAAITATRRPRSAKERALICTHVVDAPPSLIRSLSCETSRARFLGRGRSTRSPLALGVDGPLLGTTGAVLDPIFALRVAIELEPGQSARVAFTTFVAPTREATFALADRYHQPQAAQRALDLAWTATQVELRELSVSPAQASTYQELAGPLLYATPSLRASPAELRMNHGSQLLLWEQGISGDWPIVLATIDAHDGIATLRELFAAHHYWRRRGMAVDLVVLNTQPSLYLQELAHEIRAGLFGSSDAGMLDRPGGVFVLRRDLLKPQTLLMLRATARVHVTCDGRPLGRSINKAADDAAAQVEAERATPPRGPQQGEGAAETRSWLEELSEQALDAASRETPSSPATAAREKSPSSRPPRQFDNGFGRLTSRGTYQMHIEGDQVPPAPWSNVIANPSGGFVVTERGGGFAWANSSYFYRLTPFHNDAVSDPPGEVLYLKDEDSGEVWSATPAPIAGDAPYTVEHGAGWSSFAHEHSEIASRLTLGLADEAAVKISRLRIENRGSSTRRIEITAYVEWTLGVLREHTQHQVHTRFDATARALFAQNYYDPHYASWVAFCATTDDIASHSGSRRSFIGRNGSLAQPDALNVSALDGQTGAGVDPCAALRSSISLAPGASHELVVVLGAAPSELDARALIAKFCSLKQASAALAESADTWTQRLSVVSVRTPEPSFDAMLNRFTLYQTLACRMWARSALYQSSGAYGFRDQLQDAMALVYAEPTLAREHLLRAASRQFEEGDVQHWWHEGTGRGVRTRFSDDLAFLPFVVAHYVCVTGDVAVLNEEAGFLTMRQLADDEHELYAEPQVSGKSATLYAHCVLALEKACTSGPHALPLMGGGDWNDGMNLVGAGGRGESVWLAWFLIRVLRDFAPIVATRDEPAAAALLQRADDYAVAVETHGWDGEWYRRAYFDDGSALGSADSDECRIDSIAQSWSAISGAGEPERTAQALRALTQHLVDDEARLVLLLTPPFDKGTRDPGYIKGYLPGVRENGAQYTHAALWAALAFALRGEGDRAFSLYQMLNPLTHTRTPEAVAVYKVEPYVVAADVYAAEGHRGRGGWTWYTGSASWMYRVGLEAILGFDKRGDKLHIAPAVPAGWPGYAIDYRFGESMYQIEVDLTDAGKDAIELDGRPLSTAWIPLVDDGGRHQARVVRVRRR